MIYGSKPTLIDYKDIEDDSFILAIWSGDFSYCTLRVMRPYWSFFLWNIYKEPCTLQKITEVAV